MSTPSPLPPFSLSFYSSLFLSSANPVWLFRVLLTVSMANRALLAASPLVRSAVLDLVQRISETDRVMLRKELAESVEVERKNNEEESMRFEKKVFSLRELGEMIGWRMEEVYYGGMEEVDILRSLSAILPDIVLKKLKLENMDFVDACGTHLIADENRPFLDIARQIMYVAGDVEWPITSIKAADLACTAIRLWTGNMAKSLVVVCISFHLAFKRIKELEVRFPELLDHYKKFHELKKLVKDDASVPDGIPEDDEHSEEDPESFDVEVPVHITKKQRLIEMDERTSKMGREEYLGFTKARAAGFGGRKLTEFLNWINCSKSKKIGGVVAYISLQKLYGIIDDALRIHQVRKSAAPQITPFDMEASICLFTYNQNKK